MIPGQTSTGSKRSGALFGDGAPPLRMVRAEGCRVWDEHGREYTDMIMALGAVALGYAHPAVTDAAVRAVRDGAVGPLPPKLECDVAERLVAWVPGAEAVRFFKTGAEAVAAAVRIARVITGRDAVVVCGYHGWLDWCQDEPGVPTGVRALCRSVPFNDVAAARAVGDRTTPAAIVVEPVIDGPPSSAWLGALREAADRYGAVLVFDEIKTGIRFGRGGAAARYGARPDLVVLGKALGNGFPIAAVVGGADVMGAAARTWISSTLATEYVALAAARAVLDEFERHDVPAHLAQTGAGLMAGLADIAAAHPRVVHEVRGIPEFCYLAFRDDAVSGRVAARAAERGLLFKRTAYNFVSLAHTGDVISSALDLLRDVIAQVDAC